MSYPELVGEPLRLELIFARPLKKVTELIVLGERTSSIAVDKLGIVERRCKKIFCSATKYQTYPSDQNLVPRFVPPDYVPTHDNDTFAVTNTQPSNMQGEH